MTQKRKAKTRARPYGCLRRVVRLALYVPMMVFEIGLLLLCYVLAFAGLTGMADRIADWAVMTLPDGDWYFSPNVERR